MALLVKWIGHVRSAHTADFLHNGLILARTVAEERPVGAAAAIDYVVNRSRAQLDARIYMPMLHR